MSMNKGKSSEDSQPPNESHQQTDSLTNAPTVEAPIAEALTMEAVGILRADG